MPVPRVLVLIPFVPGDAHGGDVFVRGLLRHYPKQMLCCFALQSHRDGSRPLPQDYEGFPVAYAGNPPQSGLKKLGRYIAHLDKLALQQYLRYVLVPTLIEQAVLFGREHTVDLVWALISQDPTLLYMAKPVASALGAQLVTTVTDPPGRFVVDHGIHGLTGRVMERALERILAHTLRASVRLGVASEGMQAEYKRRYGRDSVVLIPGVSLSQKRPPATQLTVSDRFVIGVAGSLYAQREWQALLSALDGVNWCVAGREVTIRIMGWSLYVRAQGRMHIEYLGWRPQTEVLEVMSTCDITYLPYWMDKAYRHSVSLTFPAKLTTYLAAGRPVFYHGPEGSSPAQFLRRFPAGLCCHSLETEDIVASLSRFVTDRGLYAEAARQASMAVDQELNLETYLRRFASLFGIAESELRSSE